MKRVFVFILTTMFLAPCFGREAASAIYNIRLDIPDNWQTITVSENRNFALGVAKDSASISLKLLENVFTRDEMSAFAMGERLFAEQMSRAPSPIKFITNKKGTGVYFFDYTINGEPQRRCFAQVAGSAYECRAVGFKTEEDFLTIIDTLAPAREAATTETTAETPEKPADKPKAERAVNTSADDDDAVKSAEKDIRILALIAFAVFSFVLAGRVVKFFFGLRSFPEAKNIWPNPLSPFPIVFQRDYSALGRKYYFRDNLGNVCKAYCAGTGNVFFALIILCLIANTAAAYFGALERSAEIISADRLIFAVYAQTISAYLVFILAAIWAIVSVVVKKKVAIQDNTGKPAAYLIKRTFFKNLVNTEVYIYNKSRSKAATLRLNKWALSRKWELYDPEGNKRLELVETSKSRAFFRKLFGHIWGALRPDYIFVNDKGENIGVLARKLYAKTQFHINIPKEENLPPMVYISMALCAEIISSDRFYPSL